MLYYLLSILVPVFFIFIYYKDMEYYMAQMDVKTYSTNLLIE